VSGATNGAMSYVMRRPANRLHVKLGRAAESAWWGCVLVHRGSWAYSRPHLAIAAAVPSLSTSLQAAYVFGAFVHCDCMTWHCNLLLIMLCCMHMFLWCVQAAS
jgi:hypothetical protein